MFIAVVKWDKNNRITKYQDFALEADADSFVANALSNFSNAFVAAAPTGGVRDWLVDGTAKTLSLDAIVDPDTPTDADEAGVKMTDDPFMRGWVKRQAAKEGKTVDEIMEEIRAHAA